MITINLIIMVGIGVFKWSLPILFDLFSKLATVYDLVLCQVNKLIWSALKLKIIKLKVIYIYIFKI